MAVGTTFGRGITCQKNVARKTHSRRVIAPVQVCDSSDGGVTLATDKLEDAYLIGCYSGSSGNNSCSGNNSDKTTSLVLFMQSPIIKGNRCTSGIPKKKNRN